MGCVVGGDKTLLFLNPAIRHNGLLTFAYGGFIERRCAWNCPSIQM